MSDSLEPSRSARAKVQQVATSLMSGASAHTVKPSLEAPSAESTLSPRRRLSFNVIALGALSAVLGLSGAASLSHLRARPAPVMQIVSGNPTLKKGSDGASVRWHSQKSKLFLDASLDQLGPQAREAVQLGFGTWLGSGAKLPNLSFDSTTGAKFGQESNGKSEIMYGPITLKGHENDLALTVTFSDPKTGEVVEADMIFNSTHPYGLLPYQAAVGAMTTSDMSSCEQRYDLQSIATHEAGHFFGLGEDYDSTVATMYYTTGRCETNKRILQGTDETTMDALYVSGDTQAASNSDDSSVETVTAKGCGGARIGQGNAGGAAPILSLLGLLGFVGWRRRRR
ncbi:MAG TPA: hypothetical protein VGF76_11110 [Polyangiaceae bacterium]